jgi:cytochrome c peroxidase
VILSSCAAAPPSASAPMTEPTMPPWNATELATLRSLWIGSLGDVPSDPSNRYADDPAAAALGEQIFFDTRFSANGRVACATCHVPELAFTDGLQRGQGIGETTRNTMPVVGTAHSPWLFWDGRKDSQWAQALAPLEDAAEHGGSRGQYAHVIADAYRAAYEAIFGSLPDLSDADRFPADAGPVDDAESRAAWESMTEADRDAVTHVYVNIGKAIAAFERTLVPAPSRVDAYIESQLAGDRAETPALGQDEVAGLELFIGSARCTDCHNGPLLTNQSFHNTGVPPLTGREPDRGRQDGIGLVQADEFNCLSRWSDADPEECSALRFLRNDAEAFAGAFRPPSLRDVSRTGPYMHAGQFETLLDVLRHYRDAPAAAIGHTELEPVALSDAQLAQLEAFLRALDEVPATPEP